MSNNAPLFFEQYKQHIDAALNQAIEEYTDGNSKLAEAIHYSSILGGKRIRPILLLATAECYGTTLQEALTQACAVEFIHAYSLIHDDLPAMDDDDLRRGQPTCHRAFDEATAILAGDAMQTLAFELLSQQNTKQSANNQLNTIAILAKASGARGMVLGQAIDLYSVGQKLDLQQLENMHRHKTGALIEASILIGAHCGSGALSADERLSLEYYAQAVGLAFQVQDDILDVISDTAILGKQQGADLARNKPTYPSLLGLEGAENKLRELHKQAVDALSKLSHKNTEKLRDIADFIVKRSL